MLECITHKILADSPTTQAYLVCWQESQDLLDRFRTTFAHNPNVRIMSRADVCLHFGVKDDEDNRDKALSALCRRMKEEERRTGLPHCLLVDELPPQTGDWQSSCDWRQVDTRSLRLVLSIQPTAFSSSSLTPVPTHGLTMLTLERVFRCNHRILLTHTLQHLAASCRY